MEQKKQATFYANQQMEYFPNDWDQELRDRVWFMIRESFQLGEDLGMKLGLKAGQHIAYQSVLNKLLNNLQQK